MIQLYAITDFQTPPLPDIPSLRTIATRDLAAVCAPVTDDKVTAETLWRHEQVVEALMADRDVLPVRYGTRLPDEAAAARVLEADYDRLSERLDFVRGAAEVSVRGFAAVSDSERTEASNAERVSSGRGSGTDYLRGKARELADVERAARAVHEPLSSLARATAVQRPTLAGEIMCSAYLIARERVDDFAQRVAEVQDANPTLRLSCTGPWPPYSFAQQ